MLLHLTLTKTGWECWCWDFYISSFVFSKFKSPDLPKEDVSISFWKMKSSRDSKAKAAADSVPPRLLVDDLSKICSSGSIYFLSLFWSFGCWLAAFLQRGNRRWRLHSYPALCLRSSATKKDKRRVLPSALSHPLRLVQRNWQSYFRRQFVWTVSAGWHFQGHSSSLQGLS